MRFRTAVESDRPRIISLWHDCGLTRPWNDPDKDFSFAVASPTSAILLAEEDGKVIASAMAGHDGHRGMLYYVAVDPSRRRRGLGREAVKAAESFLAAQGVWKINLLVRAENDAVRGFYEALGYEINPVLCMGRKIDR